MTAKTFRSSRRISPSMCCHLMSCASIPRTGNSFFTATLYCALASAIGEGGRSFRQLVRELEQKFPSDKIHEALKRLVDRRYVLPASRSSVGAVAAYWASLGLPPATAEENLQKCRVRIQSIDVQGATELGAALKRSGRSRRQAIPRPHGHAGERLSRRTTRRIEPAAAVGPNALAARPAFRYFSPGGAGVQPGQERLLDLPHRANATEPGGQGIPRTQTGAPHRRFASRPAACSDRAASSLRPSRSQERSPPTFARTCAITSSASTFWDRPS